MHRACSSVWARCRDALSAPPSLPAWPWGAQPPQTPPYAYLLPGERRVDAQLSPPQHIPARRGLVITHPGGFAFACSSTGKQTQMATQETLWSCPAAPTSPRHPHDAARDVPVMQPRDHTCPCIGATPPDNAGRSLRSCTPPNPINLGDCRDLPHRGGLEERPDMAPVHPFNGADGCLPLGTGHGRPHSQKKRSFSITWDRLGAPSRAARAGAAHAAQQADRGTQGCPPWWHPSRMQNEPRVMSLGESYAVSFPKINVIKAQPSRILQPEMQRTFPLPSLGGGLQLWTAITQQRSINPSYSQDQELRLRATLIPHPTGTGSSGRARGYPGAAFEATEGKSVQPPPGTQALPIPIGSASSGTGTARRPPSTQQTFLL